MEVTAYDHANRDPTSERPAVYCSALGRATTTSAKLLPQQPQDQADHCRNDEAGRNRKIERKTVALDMNVTRQAAEAKPGEQRPGQPRDNEDDPERDQEARHETNKLTT